MIKEYLINIRPYLKNVNDLKKSDTWKFQLVIAINFMSPEGNDEQHVIHSKIAMSDLVESINESW